MRSGQQGEHPQANNLPQIWATMRSGQQGEHPQANNLPQIWAAMRSYTRENLPQIWIVMRSYTREPSTDLDSNEIILSTSQNSKPSKTIAKAQISNNCTASGKTSISNK
jgi:hypothetical protein